MKATRHSVILLSPIALVLSVILPAGAAWAAPVEDARAGETRRVSVGPGGAQLEFTSQNPDISANGRFVAFESDAPNLVPDDTNETNDVFVADLQKGAIERISVATDGTEANNVSANPTVSASGRYVAFTCLCDNLVTDGEPGIYLRDRVAGTTELITVRPDGAASSGGSVPSISASGRYVAFTSSADDLVAQDVGPNSNVFVRDRSLGVTEWVSPPSFDADPAFTFAGNGAISPDGRYVTYQTTSLVPGPGDQSPLLYDVFLYDRRQDTAELVSMSSDETQANKDTYAEAVSHGGRFVVFQSFADNLVPNDNGAYWDFFVRDRKLGLTERVSVTTEGQERGGDDQFWSDADITPNGRWVVYGVAADLAEGDGNNDIDVYLHDRLTHTTELVSVAMDGGAGVGTNPVMSADGRQVAFVSMGTQLVDGDTNDDADIFVRDRGPALGVGGAAAQREDDDVSVSGWATFSGVGQRNAGDPTGDAGAGGDQAGADLTWASVAYGPEWEELLVTWRVSQMPPEPGPPTGYALDLVAGGVPFRVAASAAGFELQDCDGGCAPGTAVEGSIGSATNDVRVTVPMSLLGGVPARLGSMRAFTTAGPPVDASVPLDEAELGHTTVHTPTVRLAAVPAGGPAPVGGWIPGPLVDGLFEVTLTAPVAVDVWAMSCLGHHCTLQWLVQGV